ncbi:hypothetical protein CI089_00370 [Microbacterium sp. Yaish 1]|nr:hypothetical protein CI089_00370 [Microbacterium sp. Yaish 1]
MTWEPSAEELTYWRGREGRKREDVLKVDVDPNELFASATNVDRAAQAEFSGQYDASSRWLPKHERRGSDRQPAIAQRVTDLGKFVGIEVVIEATGSDQRLRLFQGVEIHVAEELRGFDEVGVTQAQESFARTKLEPSQRATVAAGVDDAAQAVAYSSDGSILELSVD